MDTHPCPLRAKFNREGAWMPIPTAQEPHMITLRKSAERGRASHGWLESAHTFSFGSYFDINHQGHGNLLVLNDGITPAIGAITHLTGRILDAKGNPVKNAVVEIWHCDQNGAYLHSGTGNADKRDKNFQGFGRFLTGKSGEYYFRTIKPVPYPGRTPHIHFAVKIKGQEKFTTQCYVKGDAGNARDGIWRSVRDEKQRDSITVDFAPIKESKIGELAAKFEIVMGFTPEA